MKGAAVRDVLESVVEDSGRCGATGGGKGRRRRLSRFLKVWFWNDLS